MKPAPRRNFRRAFLPKRPNNLSRRCDRADAQPDANRRGACRNGHARRGVRLEEAVRRISRGSLPDLSRATPIRSRTPHAGRFLFFNALRRLPVRLSRDKNLELRQENRFPAELRCESSLRASHHQPCLQRPALSHARAQAAGAGLHAARVTGTAKPRGRSRRRFVPVP